MKSGARLPGQRGVLDDVGPDDPPLGGHPAEDREGLVVGAAARLRRAGRRDERAVEEVDVEGHVDLARQPAERLLHPGVGAVHLAVRDDHRAALADVVDLLLRDRADADVDRRNPELDPAARRAGVRVLLALVLVAQVAVGVEVEDRHASDTSRGAHGSGPARSSARRRASGRSGLRPSRPATTFSRPSTQASGSMLSGSQPAACGRRRGRPPRRARRRRARRSATPRGSRRARSWCRRRRRRCARRGTGRTTTRLFSSVFVLRRNAEEVR